MYTKQYSAIILICVVGSRTTDSTRAVGKEKAKFHYTGPTGPARNPADFVADPVAGAVEMSGRVRSVFKFHRTGPTRLCRRPASKQVSDINPFLPRAAMLMRYMLSSCVRPSVCLSPCSSLTSRYCVKSDKLRIAQTTPHDSPDSLVFEA